MDVTSCHMVEQWKKIMVHKNARQQSTGSVSSSRNISEFIYKKKSDKKKTSKNLNWKLNDLILKDNFHSHAPLWFRRLYPVG